MQRCFWSIACALGMLGATEAARAAAIVGSMHEPFDYAYGAEFGSRNGGQGFNDTGTTEPNAAAANWGAVLTAGNVAFRVATSPTLDYSAFLYLPAFGNKLTLDAAYANLTQNVGRTLGGQTIDAGTTYFSLLMSSSNATTRTMNWAFFNGTSERFAVGRIGAAAGHTSGNIGMIMNNSNPAGLIQSTAPIAMGVGVTHLIIGRIDWNASGFETVSLWVDPPYASSEAEAGPVYCSTSAFELTAITAVRPFAGNNATVGGIAVPGAIANFDEFRIGGTWESVTQEFVPPLERPVLLSERLAGGSVRIYWQPAPTFVLDQTMGLSTPPASISWSQVPFPYQTNATHISITVPPGTDSTYYRLRKP